MKKPKLDVPSDNQPRDVSRPALRRRPGVAKSPGHAPTPESDSRSHQRFSGEGESLPERDRRR